MINISNIFVLIKVSILFSYEASLRSSDYFYNNTKLFIYLEPNEIKSVCVFGVCRKLILLA